METAETAAEPPAEDGRGPEPAVDDPEVEEIVVDTPPRNDMTKQVD